MALKKSYPLLEKTDPWICVAAKLNLSIRIIGRIYRKHLQQHQITMSQLSVLMVTGKARSIPQSELGKLLKLERSTVSRDLKRLIDRGFLVREGKDNRPHIAISVKGAAHIEKIIPDWQQATAEASEKLGPDGDSALNLVLQKLMN